MVTPSGVAMSSFTDGGPCNARGILRIRRSDAVSSWPDTTRETILNVPIERDTLTASGLQSATRQVTYDALVLDARLRQALAAVRSLGRRGLKVAAVGSSDRQPALASRWCQQAFVCPTEEGTDAYLPYLEQLLEHTPARVLVASSEGTIPLLRRHRERLEQRVRIALAAEPALAIASNKARTLEIARQLGLCTPRSVHVGAASDVRAAVRDIGLPAVVKPMLSWAQGQGQGTYVISTLVTTPDDALRAVEKLASVGMTALFQEFLSGRRESLTFMYANHQMYARFAQWGKRVYPPLGGQSVLGQSIAVPPDIGDQAERLVREIELEGCSHVEFRRDSAGHPYLMEINPRLAASTELAVRSGVDFPYLLYQWASGQKIDVVEGYRVGVWLRYLSGDLMTTVAAVQQRGRPGVAPPAKAIVDFCLAFFVPMGYYYVDWRDPGPAWTATTGFVGHAVRKARTLRLSRAPR